MPSDSQALLRQLTRPQRQAMQAFRGNGGTASDDCVWMEGTRPWPTMSNLETKGMVVCTGWFDENTGHEYSLTTAGAQWLIATGSMSQQLAVELLYAGQTGDVEWAKRNA